VTSEKPLPRDYTLFYKECVNEVKSLNLPWGTFRYLALNSKGRSLFKDLSLSIKIRSVEDKSSLDIIIFDEEADEETNDYLYELFSVTIDQDWLATSKSLSKPKFQIKQLLAKYFSLNGFTSSK